MKILLSGSTGFVGSNIIDYFLEKNVEVVRLDRKSLMQRSLTWQQISEVPDLDIDAIIHLAGKAHDTVNSSDPEEYFHVNTELTRQFFDCFLQSSARDFIYFSSVKAAADTVKGMLDENVIPNPHTPYGKSKLKAEEYILSHSLPMGKRVIILRPCMIHGRGNKGNMNLLYKVVKMGIPYPLAAFENKRSFLSIYNLLFIIERILIDPMIPSGIYNVADDEFLSTIEVIKIIAEGGGIKPRLWKLSPRIIRATAKIGDKLYLPLNSERLKKLTEVGS